MERSGSRLNQHKVLVVMWGICVWLYGTSIIISYKYIYSYLKIKCLIF